MQTLMHYSYLEVKSIRKDKMLEVFRLVRQLTIQQRIHQQDILKRKVIDQIPTRRFPCKINVRNPKRSGEQDATDYVMSNYLLNTKNTISSPEREVNNHTESKEASN
ncbi:Uncharacterized protein APZ42_013927 [Daphnia magna]|uniref:Uncharacterized protein n=2 Tax=Daphnia magna TaxID=35525 RepID=A0A0P5UM37_9CRUS|nr:hypothetical protein OUZ56_027399 [Daphnia magna]KZS19590.1 Uncharacterized protein APZ42_013927 [Daphnia magna]